MRVVLSVGWLTFSSICLMVMEISGKTVLTNMMVFYRSSRSEVFCKKGALKNFAKFTRTLLCQRPFLNKVAGLQGRRQRHTHTHTFVRSKKKKEKQRTKERVSIQKLLLGCHQVQNVTVLAILERLEFKIFSCRPTKVANNTF